LRIGSSRKQFAKRPIVARMGRSTSRTCQFGYSLAIETDQAMHARMRRIDRFVPGEWPDFGVVITVQPSALSP